MFAWLKKILGRGVDKRLLNTKQIRDAITESERTPMSESDTGMALLKMLEADSSLTELSLAKSIGRDVKYVQKTIAAARTGNNHQ